MVCAQLLQNQCVDFDKTLTYDTDERPKCAVAKEIKVFFQFWLGYVILLIYRYFTYNGISCVRKSSYNIESIQVKLSDMIDTDCS